MCGLKEIFEGAGNFFDKKVSANPTFLLRENSNQTVFIKTLMKSFAPHLFRYAQHILHQGEGFKTLPANLQFDTFTFADAY